MRGALTLLVLLPVVTSAAQCAEPVLQLPIAFGGGATSNMTVGKLVGCMEHGPIPMKLGALSNRGTGRFTLRMENDLAQYILTFDVAKGVARLVEMNRDNGAKLSAAKDLRHFAERTCRQAAR